LRLISPESAGNTAPTASPEPEGADDESPDSVRNPPARGGRADAGADFRQGAEAGQGPPPKKFDDKDYKSAIERMPDQKFDPWRNIR
jgi:hypothetical protein